MSQIRNKIILSLLLVIPGLLLSQKPEIQTITAIKAGRLIEVSSQTIRKNMIILVAGKKILWVKPASQAKIPGKARVIDLHDHTVLPGLIDSHVHLTGQLEKNWRYKVFEESAPFTALKSVQYAKRTLEAGFTTCRNVGANEFVDVALRDAINKGYVEGPRLLVATHAIGITGGHCDLNGFRPDVFGGPRDYRSGVADGPDEVRKAVRYAIKNGADVIKTCATGGVLSSGDGVGATQYSLEELKVLVEEANKAGRRVAAHAHGTEGIKLAIRAGVTSIEHGSILDEEAVDLMLQHHTFLVPTLYVGDAVLQMAKAGKMPDFARRKAEKIVPLMHKSFRLALKKGVKIAFGTDAGVFPHGQNAREFAVMVREGMAPMQAIVSATKTAAELLGLSDQIGSLEAGKMADIVAVPGNPLKNIHTMEKVDFVMKEGVLYKHP